MSVTIPLPPATSRPVLRVLSPEAPPHLSYSQIRTYATCSLKWLYSRQYEPEFVPSALVFGKAWHAAVERYYQLALEGTSANLTTLIAAFMGEYGAEKKPIQYGKTEAAPTPEQVAKMLQMFLTSVKPGKVIAIEQEIRCALGDNLPELLGYIDLVELVQEQPGQYSLQLIDFKTCGKDPGMIDPDQLLLYAWAARKTGLLAEFDLPVRLRYDYVIKTKEPKYGTLAVAVKESAVQRVLAKIRQCWRGMKEQIAYPCPGWQCAGCGYKKRCGKWPNTAA